MSPAADFGRWGLSRREGDRQPFLIWVYVDALMRIAANLWVGVKVCRCVAVKVTARRGRCSASVCAGYDEFREWTACGESHTRAASSDSSRPSESWGAWKYRSLLTSGGTVPWELRQKALLDMGLRRNEPPRNGWVGGPQAAKVRCTPWELDCERL